MTPSPPTPGYQTDPEVVRSLGRIEGQLVAMNEATKRVAMVLQNHDTDISQLQVFRGRVFGLAAALPIIATLAGIIADMAGLF